MSGLVITAPPGRVAALRPATFTVVDRVQRTELDRLTLTPTFTHGTAGEAATGWAEGGEVWAVNPPSFQADLNYRVQGPSRDADGLTVGLVQNASAERIEALYAYQHDEKTLLARRVKFGPSKDLPLLDSTAGQQPYYDAMSSFKLIRPETADVIDEQVNDEISLVDRPNFTIPARFERSGRTWHLVPNTIEGERTLRIWRRYEDKSGGAAVAGQLQWTVNPNGSITTGAGGGAPVLDGDLASTSNLVMTELGGTFEVPQG